MNRSQKKTNSQVNTEIGECSYFDESMYLNEIKKLKEKLEEVQLNYNKKTEFFTNMSHEFRTPLNIIFATVQLLELYSKKHPKTDNFLNCSRHINTIKQNCLRLLKLINNTLDVTRMDSGFYGITPVNLDIVLLVKNITLSISQYLDVSGLYLNLNSNMEKKIIACDADKIERVILNILSNSIKFTNLGGNITVSLSETSENVLISIKDTGIGIPNDKLKDVFTRFKQIDGTCLKRCEGSGIGLNIAKSIIDMHGGDILVKSELSKGSEFIIKLPNEILPEMDEMQDISEKAYNNVRSNQIESINIEFSDIYCMSK